MSNNIIAFLEMRIGKVLCFFVTLFRQATSLFSRTGSYRPTQKVIFIKLIEQGALVLHKSTFSAAAQKFGKENIYIATFGSNAALLDILGDFAPANRIYLSENSILSFSTSFFSALKKIRAERIDSLIDLEFFSCASAIFSYLSGAGKRVGYHRYQGGQNYRGDLFTHRLNYSPYLSVEMSSWSMLECLSRDTNEYPSLPPLTFDNEVKYNFIPSSEDIDAVSGLLNNIAMENIIVVNPSFRDVLPLRAWPDKYYADLIKQLSNEKNGATFVFTGRADEYSDTDTFIKKINPARALNLCGKTDLRQLFTLYTVSKLLITSDSGPVHFASLTSIPTIALFGPETPVLYGPKSPNIHILYKGLPCSPCYNVYNNRLSSCRNNLCLKLITVNEVFDLSIKLLKSLDNSMSEIKVLL